MGHLGLASVTEGRETEIIDDPALEAIFRRRGLTAYLSGHQHGYYPGARGGVRMVSMACLGSGQRPLIGTNGATPRAFVQIDVRNGRVSHLEALLAPEYVRPIARSSLPRELVYGSQRLQRDDLAGF